jgi:hypothetical protein
MNCCPNLSCPQCSRYRQTQVPLSPYFRPLDRGANLMPPQIKEREQPEITFELKELSFHMPKHDGSWVWFK